MLLSSLRCYILFSFFSSRLSTIFLHSFGPSLWRLFWVLLPLLKQQQIGAISEIVIKALAYIYVHIRLLSLLSLEYMEYIPCHTDIRVFTEAGSILSRIFVRPKKDGSQILSANSHWQGHSLDGRKFAAHFWGEGFFSPEFIGVFLVNNI